MSRRHVLHDLTIVCSLGASAGCHPAAPPVDPTSTRSTTAADPVSPVAPPAVPTQFAVVTAFASELHETIDASADLEPTGIVQVSTVLAGQILVIYADVGARVRKGQILVHLDDRAAEVALHKAVAQLDDARRAHADLHTAQAAVDEAKLAIESTAITCPIDGVVIARPAEVGQVATAGATLLAIAADPTHVVARTHVAARDVPAIRLAAEASVTVDGLADRQYLGRVIQVPAAAQNGSFEVEVAIDNPELALRFGMPAHVAFAGPTRTAVLVPKAAITFGPAPGVVWIVAGDQLERRQVRIGVDSGKSVEIVAGVAAGEHLAVSPADDPARR